MWASGWGLIPTLILLWPLQGHAANFTFTYGAATQCDDFTVSWTGGSPPFQLTLAHVYGVPRTLDIPANSFSNGKGSFTTPLTIPAKDQFIAIMSDSTGFASGGASPLITAGKPSGKNTCSVTDPKLDFDYENNAALNQCRTYSFDNYVGAVQPVTIQGIVPGGTTFALYPPKGPTTFEWIADVAAGTQLVFIMTDSQGRQGGSSQVYTVGISDDATCLDKNSPATVAHPPSQSTSAGKPTASKTHTASATSTATSTAVPDGSGSSSKTSGGTIAAAIIGCLVGAFIVGTLVWFYMRRRRGTSVLKGGIFGKFQKKEVDLMHDPTIPPPAAVSPYPLYHPQAGSQVDVYTPNSTVNLLGNGSIGAGGRPSGDPFGTASAYAPSTTMFASQPPAPGSASIASGFPGGVPPPGHRDSIHDGSVHGGSVSSWDQSVTSAMRRKAANAGVSPYAPSTRFILHTDLEDDPPPPPDDEVIELPPQYSERRAPPPALDVGQPVAGPSGSRMEPSAPSASSSGYGSSSRYADTSELPPPPSPSIHSSSPGLAYLSDRNSFAPSEHSSVGTSRPS